MLFSGKRIQLEKNLHDRRSRQISKSVGAQCPGVMKNRYLLKNHVPSQNIRVQTAIRPDEYDNIKNIYSPNMFPTQPVVRPDDPIKAMTAEGPSYENMDFSEEQLSNQQVSAKFSFLRNLGFKADLLLPTMCEILRVLRNEKDFRRYAISLVPLQVLSSSFFL